MDWMPWIAAALMSSLVGLIVRIWLPARIQKSIQYEYDRKLEELRGELRRDEERLKADLKKSDDQIAALRNNALSTMASRYMALDRRKLEAVEKLWESIVNQGQLKMLARMSGSINMDVAIELAAQQNSEGRSVREFAEGLWHSTGIDIKDLPKAPDKERPFLSPIVWAIYSAFRNILSLTAAQFIVLRTGTGPKILADTKAILDLVKSALPHRSDYIDQWGTSCLPYLLEELEEKLLAELMVGLDGANTDEESVKKAAGIIRAANKAVTVEELNVDIPNIKGLRRQDEQPKN